MPRKGRKPVRSTTTAVRRTTPARERVPGRLYHLRDVDPVLWTEVKVRAAREGVPIRTVIIRALERYAAGR
jgi:hypothetical protein